jgi:hypothetical protein
MLEIFRGSDRRLQEQVQQLARELFRLRSDMNTRVQQVEAECARIGLQRVLREIHKTAELAVQRGIPAARAIESGLRAAVAPLPRGRAGGLARARSAWRYRDGTFMPESERFEAYREERERHAVGGRARAKRAARYVDGTFAPDAR